MREKTEQRERHYLSPFAMCSADSRGRKKPEPPCPLRTAFQRDRDRILHSKAFRRLKHKTQVYIDPWKDHYRTRMTHTLEVAQIGRTIARALDLNEDLVEAIALGHDLGHTPFGHMGESILNELNPNGFRHYEQSVRVVERLESTNKRQGLNLTYEVLEGISHHTGDRLADTLESRIMKYADRIAYINHDIDDSIRAGLLHEEDLPAACTDVLGRGHGERISTMILDIVEQSTDHKRIQMSEPVQKATDRLRSFLFDTIYLSEKVKSEADQARFLLETLYGYYLKDLNRLPEEHRAIYPRTNEDASDQTMVTDYIAGMTDRFAIAEFERLVIPKGWRN